jgi:cytochrome d ubiquinol oxidase subunit II
MTLADLILGVLWAGLTAYAVLGGADFGAGVLHLLAPATPAGRRRRLATASAMGPVWEANHVWLIFFLTGLLTAFPSAFAALGAALLLPATLALVGIVVRGTAFAFASQLPSAQRARAPLHRAFGLASAATPLLFGAIAGGLARQRVVIAGTRVRSGGGLALWVGPLPLTVGLLALAACTALAATFMTVEMARAGERSLTRSFHAIALRATAVTSALALVGLGVAAATASEFFHGLTGRGLPAVLAALLALATALVALRRRHHRLARAAVATAVAGFVWGWGLAQFPRLVGPRITAARAAAPAPELHAIAISLAAGAAALVPALWLLYAAFRRHPTEVIS